jgi:hypothetical protein
MDVGTIELDAGQVNAVHRGEDVDLRSTAEAIQAAEWQRRADDGTALTVMASQRRERAHG